MSGQKLEPEKNNKNPEITAQDILLEIGSIGSGQATVALSTMLNEQVNVEVPRLHVKPPHLVPQIYEKHDTPVVAIFMQLRENMSCDLMLIFEDDEAKKIARIMTDDVKTDQEIEKSALEELGSIMLCSFLNAMANFTSTQLLPTPPLLIYDAFDAVIDELLSKQALCSDTAAIFDARFKRSTSSAEGYLIMFPSEKLQKIMVKKGRKWLEYNGQENQHNNRALNDSSNK
ncbi:MAG: chemotaxis protein CheC [Candidatus Bathyarchaeota archaeon]|nr:chemotaxis protein CheC [Candidatus Bathyarchaeota archaeon]